MQSDFLTLRQFTGELSKAIRANSSLQNRWITAELSDMTTRGGHCYMELIEKDDSGNTVARLRATIWANIFAYRIKPKFEKATEQTFASGIKVMIFGSITFHEVFGLSFNITDIEPSYTLGDAERIRREILQRLTAEGIIDCNKLRPVPMTPQRIAVISSPSAAGYGDFMNQLTNNRQGYIFYTHLFEATMQGERTALSILQALQQIEMTIDLWDCVVIIRGGGATNDLQGFDNLELARRVAGFPIPIIVGIGHERDRTVLDEIAAIRVKTPTAAAEWLIRQIQIAFDTATSLVESITTYATERISGATRQLAYLQGIIPVSASQKSALASSVLSKLTAMLPHIVSNKTMFADRQLKQICTSLHITSQQSLVRENNKLESSKYLLRQIVSQKLLEEKQNLVRFKSVVDVLSPQNTLNRGYSITRCNGKVVKDIDAVKDGDTLSVTLASGSLISIVKK